MKPMALEAGNSESGSIVRPKPLHASRPKIRQAADHVRRAIQAALRHKPDTKLDLNKVVDHLGGQIRYRSFLETLTSEDGAIEIRGPRSFVIYLSNATSPRRDRFTIAHELGHYFLHFPQQRDEMSQGKVMVGRRSGAGREETEAHWFAAEFLMPADDFQRAWKKYGGNLSAVAETFDVSTHAAEVRASSLGLA
jgi:Zn-dependent peptidase ImmA (M78 family)